MGNIAERIGRPPRKCCAPPARGSQGLPCGIRGDKIRFCARGACRWQRAGSGQRAQAKRCLYSGIGSGRGGGWKIVGHILFTKVDIGGSVQLALAPLSVLPECQRRGVGSALIREGHRRARELGYGYSIVLGSETYYPAWAMCLPRTLALAPPFTVADENFMACKLRVDAPAISGVVQYAKEFGIP